MALSNCGLIHLSDPSETEILNHGKSADQMTEVLSFSLNFNVFDSKTENFCHLVSWFSVILVFQLGDWKQMDHFNDNFSIETENVFSFLREGELRNFAGFCLKISPLLTLRVRVMPNPKKPGPSQVPTCWVSAGSQVFHYLFTY